jgi:hypothetical protein|tara:strand:- start:153 stop:374 length:222 start_codon:yes stop_codon:yes gene_type:complete
MRRKLKVACGGDGAAAFWPAVKSNKLKCRTTHGNVVMTTLVRNGECRHECIACCSSTTYGSMALKELALRSTR